MKRKINIFKVLLLCFVISFLILNYIFYALLQYRCEGNTGNMIRSMVNYPDPVDVVYTWVNGSDSRLISQLNIYRRSLYLDRNLYLDGMQYRFSCPYPICAFNDHVLLSATPPHTFDTESLLIHVSQTINTMLNSSSNTTLQFVKMIQQSEISRRSGMLLHSSVDISQLFVNQSDVRLRPLGQPPVNVTLSQVFIAAGAEVAGLPMDDSVFIHGLTEMKDADIEVSYRSAIAKFTRLNVSLVKASSASFLVLLPPGVNFDALSQALANQSSLANVVLSRSYFVIDAGLATVVSDLSDSRYQDNEELRYSLRSLDTFLGFYRRIFIVTNGQVPSWLDTDHPRITLVSHSQIFPNASHLPTFNSAAIEANLHNIPGLAAHFIYLNDDVFFGKPVSQEDFFSLTTGYKIFLGWSVPDCVERCPNSWLADGFCDHECNVPECQWDAGDCVKTHGKVGSVDFASLVNQSAGYMNHFAGMTQFLTGICRQGCNHNWLADRYCDSSCNDAACGFDLGDCGDASLLSLPSFVVSRTSGQLFHVPNGTLAFVLDLRSLIDVRDNVTKASIDDVKEVLASSYALKYRLLTLLLKKKEACGDCYNRAHFVININITVHNGSTLKYNIATGLVLNARSTTESFITPLTPYPLSTITSTSTIPWPSIIYKVPQNLTLNIPSSNITVSIETIEWLRPLEMSHYRLLLEDGLISLSGYHHLVRQLWLSLAASKTVSIPLTAMNRDLRLENLAWGFLPWERSWLTRLHGASTTARLAANASLSDTSATMRRPLDLYAESLRHSNRLMSGVFGLSQRRVPAHGPHFISTSILQDAHKRFQDPWARTSSHRFRTPFDVQFAFSYFYYLMSEKRNVTVRDVLRDVDSDKSGSLDPNELRSLALILGNNETISDERMNTFLAQVRQSCNCTLTDENVLVVQIAELSTCLNVTDSRPSTFVPKHAFVTHDDSDLAFIMISPRRDKVLHDLDMMRRQPRKFFCLNDNLPAAGDSSNVSAVRRDLRDFLRYMFPFPSQFERKASGGRRRNTWWWWWWSRVVVGVLVVGLLLLGLRCRCGVRMRRGVRRWLCTTTLRRCFLPN